MALMNHSITNALRNPSMKLAPVTTEICSVLAQTRLRSTCRKRSTRSRVRGLVWSMTLGTTGYAIAIPAEAQ